MSHDQHTDSGHADTPLFDPRHSPVFQRGYDPEADVVVVPAASTRRASARLFSGRERVVGQERVPGHDRAVDHPVAPPIPVAAEQSAVDPVEEWTGDMPAHNPFIVALWIVGIGLIVAAVSFQWWALSQNNNGYSGSEMPIEYVLQQLSWSISSPMISTGMLTIVGLIVWKALRWQEREGAAAGRAPLGDRNE